MKITADIPIDQDLADLQKVSFGYFLHETNPRTGLVADRTRVGSPASIAAVGMALTAYPIGVERGFCTREEARRKTLAVLRFLWNSPQGPERDAAGYKGFFYHFLDMESGRRVWKCELSTIDTALLMAGVLAAGHWFNHDSAEEAEIRDLADRLYRRVDWRWALNGGATLSHGWRPERGFLRYRWAGYDEALILYLLALGSPTFPIPPESYAAWLSTYRWKSVYGHEFVYAGPLFIHQFSHIWVDFRGIRDAFMREHGSDYFENSRTATYVQRAYAMRNPGGFAGYGAECWGITASDGPGRMCRTVGERQRRFFSYHARGAPFGPDDGTVSPWAAVASLPFAPEIVLPAIRHFHDLNLHMDNPYGFTASFNPTLAEPGGSPAGWVAPDHVGINQGPVVLMLENYRSGFVWRLMRRSPYLVEGLRRAGFRGGWLE
ncbi:hypothetical protein ASD64_03595 [Mesorhizobium sp. Root157]|nr:glucoamylase family protein [Mesorhizobium sp. Root157]KQZ93988.1 hypothetical protein ASD64_03595 [Mesorhizobium sp. Root157]